MSNIINVMPNSNGRIVVCLYDTKTDITEFTRYNLKLITSPT